MLAILSEVVQIFITWLVLEPRANKLDNGLANTSNNIVIINVVTKVSIYPVSIEISLLKFQMTNDYPYECTAGKILLTVMENDDLVPCRRMPIFVGNLLEENMYDLYKKIKIIKGLQKDTTPTECRSCEHSKLCAGGLKCLTYAIYGDLNHKDVGCNIN